jgi:deoxyribonuclease V
MAMPLTLHHAHAWDLSPAEAARQQVRLRAYVRLEPLPADLRRVGGVDVAYRGGRARAAAVVLDFPALLVVEQAAAAVDVSFPYMPGLLAFREAPAILAALERLGALPGVLLVDGHGLAHPRRFGLASHLGVLLDLPTVGVAKSVLTGSFPNPGQSPGSQAELISEDEVLGVALRTRAGSRPVIVSVGHRADLESAVRLVLACTRRSRLPEPLRLAHHLAAGWDKIESDA